MLVVANIPQSGTVSSSQVLALFTDPDTDALSEDGTTAEFSAAINWGDGDSGTGEVSEIGTSGLYQVLPPQPASGTTSYTYSKAADMPFKVTISQGWDFIEGAIEGDGTSPFGLKSQKEQADEQFKSDLRKQLLETLAKNSSLGDSAFFLTT